MKNDFKINLYFTNNAETLEKLLSHYLISILENNLNA